MSYYNQEQFTKARKLESQGEWLDAAIVWQSISKTEDYDACMLIHESIEKGDAYRAECEPYRNQWQNRDITNDQYHQAISKIYKEHFPKSK